MITEKQIDEAIEKCYWRKEIEGASICTGNVLPCTKAIEKGLCEALINLYAKERKE